MHDRMVSSVFASADEAGAAAETADGGAGAGRLVAGGEPGGDSLRTVGSEDVVDVDA
jgi:hypothetical protein